MKALIIHNPGSGREDHSRRGVEKFVSRGNFEKIEYISMENGGLETIERYDPDLIFLAGGDGTVHKFVASLLRGEQDPGIPVHILPLGTANNIAKTLDILSPYKLHSFNTVKEIQYFDVGRVEGIKDQDFFLEGVGAGIFPVLIGEMQQDEPEAFSSSEEIQMILRKLKKIVETYEGHQATIHTSGISISGVFLLVEVMNIRHIGPNFRLAPGADPGDGYFDLVLIPVNKRTELLDYLDKMLLHVDTENDLKDLAFTMRVREASIEWENTNLHVDDDLINEFSGGNFSVRTDPRRFRFVRNP